MKKLLGFVAIFAILFAGCNKKQEEKFDSAVLIYQDGSLWTENKDGSMKWSTTLSNGTGLKVYPDSGKMAAREGKNDETEFVKVRFDNKDYWIQTALIAQNAVESVILEDTLVYQNPDIAAVTNISVPALTIVAVSNDEVVAEDPSFGPRLLRRRGGRGRRHETDGDQTRIRLEERKTVLDRRRDRALALAFDRVHSCALRFFARRSAQRFFVVSDRLLFSLLLSRRGSG